MYDPVEVLWFGIIVGVVCGLLGGAIGNAKGLGALGFLLGLLLGPFGVLIAAIMPANDRDRR